MFDPRPRSARRALTFVALALLAACCASPARASGGMAPDSTPAAVFSAGPGPTLREVLAEALTHNPDVIEARLREDSAGAERTIARGLPNPAFSVVPGNPFQYSWTEPLDVGPARLFRTRAAARGEEASRSDRQDTERQVRFTVRQAFYDLLLAEAVRAVAREQRDIYRAQLSADSLRERSGDLAERDVTRAELDLAHAEAALSRASAADRAARLQLQVLMGVARPDTAFGVSGELAFRDLGLPVDSLRAVALARRPDLASARLRVEQAAASRSLAVAGLLPVPSLTWVRQPDQPFESGSHSALGVSVTVPLLYWLGGERRRAAAALEQARTEERRTTAGLLADVAVAADAYESARALAARYEEGLLLRARRGLEESRYAYQAGSASLLDFEDAVRAYGDTRTDYYNAVHDYWLSAYALSRATGEELVP